MKLLFDQNLSPNLPEIFDHDFPGSTQTYLLGLDRETDSNLWEYAKDKEYTIITKDSDFVELATLNGPPPKVIWLNLGNCSTHTIATVIQRHIAEIKTFLNSKELDILSITS